MLRESKVGPLFVEERFKSSTFEFDGRFERLNRRLESNLIEWR